MCLGGGGAKLGTPLFPRKILCLEAAFATFGPVLGRLIMGAYGTLDMYVSCAVGACSLQYAMHVQTELTDCG